MTEILVMTLIGRYQRIRKVHFLKTNIAVL
jgi:hypothetical protein